MKKIVKILILFSIILLMGIVKISAAEPKVTLKTNEESVKAGATFDLDIDVACNTSFQGLTGKLVFNTSKLKLVKNNKDKVVVEDGY